MSKTDISLPQLRVMLAVVEQGSFTAAAETLGMTQSGVSQAVATLEAALGVPLLRRDRAGVATTEVGDRVLGHARGVLAGVDRIRQEAASAVGLERGKIRIGSFASFAARLLPGIIKGFQTRHPGIELVLLEGSDAEVRGWLASRIIDVAAVTLPTDGVEVVAETRDEMVVVVPARHRLAGRESVRLQEIAAEPFVMPVGGCESLILPLVRAQECPLNVRFEVRDSNTNLTMVAEGLGVSIFPALALPDRMKGLRTVRLDPPAWRRIALAVNPGDAQVPAVSAFLREAVRHLAPASETAAA
jgi:DNA-binding transcriptional LysR family regulator